MTAGDWTALLVGIAAIAAAIAVTSAGLPLRRQLLSAAGILVLGAVAVAVVATVRGDSLKLGLTEPRDGRAILWQGSLTLEPGVGVDLDVSPPTQQAGLYAADDGVHDFVYYGYEKDGKYYAASVAIRGVEAGTERPKPDECIAGAFGVNGTTSPQPANGDYICLVTTNNHPAIVKTVVVDSNRISLDVVVWE